MRSRPVLAALVLFLALAGCSSEEPAAPAPVTPSSAPTSSDPAPATATPDPTASSSVPVAPELPAAATAFDAAGAEAFVRHFWDVVNHAYATGDTDAVLAISDADCGACQSLVDNVKSVTDEGGTWVGMAWMTSDYVADAPDGDGVSLVSGLRQQSAGAYVLLADGSVSQVVEEEAVDFQILVREDGDAWKLQAIGSFADGSAS